MIKSNECLAKEVILELGLPFHQEYYDIALKAIRKAKEEAKVWCSECNGEDIASVCEWCYRDVVNKLQKTK